MPIFKNEPDPAKGGISGRVRWQSRSSAASIGLHPRQRRSIQAISNKGIPLGNHTSQLFSNIYLNPLDHFIKRRLRERYYIRYVDDFVILSKNRGHLNRLLPKIENYLEHKLKIKLHPEKIILKRWSKGIDFLGYILFPHHIILRPKTKRRMFKKIRKKYREYLRKEISWKEFEQTLNSYLGILKHCRSRGIINKIKQIIEEEASSAE